ncbi:MAG: hypothetical protein JWO97_873 [Acidobacteria bacterium]|nr:hypothetical protein [Acidobacteriota bacterium]
MTKVSVDLVHTGDDDERRERRRKQTRSALSAVIFIGAMLALLSAAETPKSDGGTTTQTTETVATQTVTTTTPTTTTTTTITPPPLPVSVDPAAIDFGAMPVGTSATQPVAFTNPDATEFVTAGITGGLTPTDFTIAAEKCARIAPKDFCVATITFTPHSTGPQETTFTLRAESNGSLPVKVNGSGVALVGELDFQEKEVALGSHRIGATSQRPVTIVNNGNGPLTIKTLTSGDPQFTVAGCEGTTLPAAAPCQATVEFRPQKRGRISTTLTATDDSGKSATTMVSGAGTLHMLRAVTPQLTLKQTQGKVATVIFENSGDDVVTIAGPAKITSGAYFIVEEGDGCAKKQQLQPGETCAIDVGSFGNTGRATLTVTGDGVEASVALNSGRIDTTSPKKFIVPRVSTIR